MNGQTLQRYTITGVSGDVWYGNENTIYEPVWFVNRDGVHLYIGHAKPGWTQADLKTLSELDKSYIIWLKPADYIGINEGESLYLAGNEMVDNLEQLSSKKLINFSFRGWNSVGSGKYLGRSMTPEAYNLVIDDLLTQLWVIVEKFIKSGAETPGNEVVKAVEAYKRLYSFELDRKTKAVNLGSFYLASNNARSLRIESFLATLGKEKAFETEEEFKQAVKSRLAEAKNIP